MTNSNDVRAFITTYKPIAGWKAVLMVWDEEGYVPWQTGVLGWPEEGQAIAEAEAWAEAEEIEYRPDRSSGQVSLSDRPWTLWDHRRIDRR